MEVTTTRTRPARQASIPGRVRRALEAEHARAALALALVVVVYLWPALLGGRILSPVELLSQYVPWQPGAFGHTDLINPALFDVPTSFQPWRELARGLIHAGVFPAWNPYALAGTPLFANPEVAWLSPFTAMSWLLPLNWSLGLAAALKLWAAAFGTYLLVRELRLGFWPGVVAGISFAFCAFNIVWLAHGVQVSVAVTLPWLILLVERIVRRGSSRAGFALALVAALSFSGGHPGTQLHVLTAAAIYAIARTFAIAPGLTRGERLRRLGLVAAGLAVGALLLAVTLVPGVSNANGTIGAQVRAHGGPTLPGSTLGPTALRTAMFPDWWGRPGDGRLRGPGNFNERTFYAGALALLLAALALSSLADWRQKLPFGILGALGVAVPIHVPGVYWLATHLPLYAATQNQRMLLLFMFAVAILAAFGLQALIERPREQGDAWPVVAAAAGIGVIGLVAAGPAGPWLIAVAALAAALLALRAWPDARLPIAAGVAVIVALDMLHFAHGYQPLVPAAQATPPRTEAIRYVERHIGQQRLAGVGLALPPDVPTIYRLRDARGYDAPQPSLRFFRLWQLANPRQEGWQPLDVRRLTPAGLNVLSVLGTRLIVTEPGGSAGGAADLLNLPSVHAGRDATVLENAGALPRALVAPAVRVVPDERAVLRRIAAPGFEPRREAIVERGAPGADAVPRGPARGQVQVIHDANAEVTLRADLDRRGLVLLDDALTPGWHVSVDGHAAQAVRVDSVLRGVVVPAGRHTVTWAYTVPGLRAGLALSGVGLMALLGWGLLLLRGRPSRTPPEPIAAAAASAPEERSEPRPPPAQPTPSERPAKRHQPPRPPRRRRR